MRECSEFENIEQRIALPRGGPRRYNGNMKIECNEAEAKLMEKFAENEIRDAFIKLREEEMDSMPVTIKIGLTDELVDVSVICVLRREE